jgi:hypothetical protein
MPDRLKSVESCLALQVCVQGVCCSWICCGACWVGSGLLRLVAAEAEGFLTIQHVPCVLAGHLYGC